jgi:glutamine amidotransferase
MIKIIAYGSGNVKAISNIFKRLNIACEIAETKSDLDGATKLVLPGVGAFDQSMKLFRESGMFDEANRLVLENRTPVIGVCVGLQMMAEFSEEGSCDGLSWIKGQVKKIDTQHLTQKPALPHMGWNTIEPQVDHAVLKDVDKEKGFYFLHSYRFHCENSGDILATSNYGGEFPSAVYSNNIFGFQFHPEKSHSNGISVFKNFAGI